MKSRRAAGNHVSCPNSCWESSKQRCTGEDTWGSVVPGSEHDRRLRTCEAPGFCTAQPGTQHRRTVGPGLQAPLACSIGMSSNSKSQSTDFHPLCLPRLPARGPCLSELYSYLIEIIKHRYKYRHNPYQRLRFIKILSGNSFPLRVDHACCIHKHCWARGSLSTVPNHLEEAGRWLRSSGLAAVAAPGQHLGFAE